MQEFMLTVLTLYLEGSTGPPILLFLQLSQHVLQDLSRLQSSSVRVLYRSELDHNRGACESSCNIALTIASPQPLDSSTEPALLLQDLECELRPDRSDSAFGYLYI